MAISVGDKLPSATLRTMGADGPEEHATDALCAGKKVVFFGLPGAFTGTCTTAHLPSFMRTAEQFQAKGVDLVACVSVNDVFVMQSWAESTGADKTLVQMLADPDSSFTKALGLEFTAPPVGLIDRSKRYAMLVDNGTVSALEIDENPGECTISAGESFLEKV